MTPTQTLGTSASKLRAKELAKNDYRLLRELVQLRIDSGLKQSDIADMLGITQQAVSKFESMEADPKLSTIRLYSHAVGALVAHIVKKDEGQLLRDGDGWVQAAFTTSIASAPRKASIRIDSRTVTIHSDLALAA